MTDTTPAAPPPSAETPAITAPVQPASPQAEEAVAESQRSADALSAPSLDEAMASVNFDSLTGEQAADLTSGDPVKIAAALGMKEPLNPVAKVEPKVEPANQDDEVAPTRALDRISIKSLSPEDKARTLLAIEAVRAGKSPKDAFADAFGIGGEQTPSTPVAPAESPANAPVEVVAPAVTELQSKLDSLIAKRDQARAEFSPTAEEDSDAIMELRIDIRDAKREALMEQARLATFEAQANESHARAFDKYAAIINDADSNFNDFADVQISLAQKNNDPILARPDWPEKIADRVYDKYFKARGANSTGGLNDVSAIIPPAPKNDVRFSGSPIGPTSSAGVMTPLIAEAEFSKLDQSQQDAVMSQLERLTSKKR
jgi:hypothetical protein